MGHGYLWGKCLICVVLGGEWNRYRHSERDKRKEGEGNKKRKEKANRRDKERNWKRKMKRQGEGKEEGKAMLSKKKEVRNKG